MDKNTLITTIVIMVLVVSGVIYLLWTNPNTMNNDQTNSSSSSQGKVCREIASEPTTTSTGLIIQKLNDCDGVELKTGQNALVHYKGSLLDGTVFESSYTTNSPFLVQNVGNAQVIDGWNQGLIGMKVGEKRKLTIPPALAYGDRESAKIPANSTLIFEVELMEIK